MNDKSKPALSLITPQARHHFTLFDQVNQLVEASEADADVGFMARMLALCCLPRTDPGNQHKYVRQNGPYALCMIAGGKTQLPYGSIPRLLLAYICTEAVRTQSRELVLEARLAKFMRALGMTPEGGGRRGDRARLQDQMNRLLHCTVSLIYENESGLSSTGSLIADRAVLWWDPKRRSAGTASQNKIRLGEEFFNEIIRHPVPLDMNILKAVKRSSLGLDLYMWLVYRTFTLTRPLRLSWSILYRQFGVDPSKADDKVTVQNFRRKILRELKKIKVAWPELDYAMGTAVLILSPSTPSIPPLIRPQRIGE